MYAQKKILNPQVFIELISYITFAVLMFYLVSTGKYQRYVTPRMVPYFYFTSAVMAIWALGGLFRLFRPQHKTRVAHCLILAIPIILLLLPHTPINTASLSSGYLNGSALASLPAKSPYNTTNEQNSSNSSNFNVPATAPADNQSTDNADAAETSIPSNDQSPNDIENTPSSDTIMSDNSTAESSDTAVPEAQPDEQSDIQEDETAVDLPGLDANKKKITVSNDDFDLWLSEIFSNMEKYKGYTVRITGFVFKDSEIIKANEFVPARLMMSCCAADLAPVGFLCKYDKASELKKDSWVTVEGTLFIGKVKYDGQEYDDPQISVTKIIPAQKVEGYVYPY